MNIKKTSRTLVRNYTDNERSLWYHNTRVASFIKDTNTVILRDDGWTTQNTARAMNFFFEENHLPLEARFTKSKKVNNIPTIIINGNGEEKELNNYMVIKL